jgi:formylmethanofuran dehydrogenase subunit E
MYRNGHDPENVLPSDVICDFCLRPAWELNLPCVEGHHGSIICGDCLEAAAVAVRIEKKPPVAEIAECTLCLEKRSEPGWSSDAGEGMICTRCIKQSSGVLHKSKDWEWERPDRF